MQKIKSFLLSRVLLFGTWRSLFDNQRLLRPPCREAGRFRRLAMIALVLALTLPTFWRMVRPGIYSMQDPVHYLRLVDYYKCFEDWNFPCRWSQSSGLGYGEPVFNYYGQLPYFVGGLFHLVGFPFIDSLKLLFILSLAGSGLFMFLLAKHLWKDNWAALVSSVVYVYAPYRAVDVWVRGALPEALAFVLFPLIILFLDKYFEKENKVNLLWFSFFLFLLVITHNLSFLLFLPFLVGWIVFGLLLTPRRWPNGLLRGGLVTSAVLLSFLMSSFYILPVIFESKFVDLAFTTQGYFDFRGHFASLNELLFSRFWGYGASLFQATDMSRAVGQVQWILSIAAIAIWLYDYIVRKIRNSQFAIRNLIVLMLIGWFMLFLTHNKSTFIWEAVPLMAYIQFPWRFLGIATFCFALASGSIILALETPRRWPAGLLRGGLVGLVCLLTIGLNIGFFKEDIWKKVTDKDMLSETRWTDIQRASVGDFWPQFGGQTALYLAPLSNQYGSVIYKNSYRVIFELSEPTSGKVEVPVNYFPGWQAYSDNKPLATSYTKDGLITVEVDKSDSKLQLVFENTPVRRIGNILSLAGIMIFGYLWIFFATIRQ